MIKFTPCKINIGLNIISRRPDNYHDIATIMVPVSWYDVLEIVPSKHQETTLTMLGRPLTCNPDDNLVMRAYKLLSDHVGGLPPVDIYLEKIIPDGAGLGGGSANASFTLLTLNEMFNLGLNKATLALLASKLGADCPLFIYNKPMLATGTGTTLTPIDIDLSHYYIVICKPNVHVPTSKAYQGVNPHPWSQSLETMIPNLIESRPINDFEESIFKEFPEIGDLKGIFYSNGAIYASMSGSGASVFGMYDNEEIAKSTAQLIKDKGIVHICKVI